MPDVACYVFSSQNSSSPFFTGLLLTGLPDVGLFMDDRAISISSSSSDTLGLDAAGFTGGARFLVGGAGGRCIPGFTAVGAGFAIGFVGGLAGAVFLVAVADHPQAGQTPLKFNASPHSLHSGTG